MNVNRRLVLGAMVGGGVTGSGFITAEAQDKTGSTTSQTKVMDGAEPFAFDGSDRAVLVIHGFTGTTQSVRYLGEQLNKRFGFTVRGPRLAGHGTSPEDMAGTSYLDWVASAEAVLEELAENAEQVFVTGLSMGGTITLNLAARFPDKIAGIVPINAVAGIVSDGLTDLMMNREAPDMIPGIGSDIKAKDVKELAYEQVPIRALRDIYLLQAVTGDLLPRIKTPVQVIQSREDHIVDPKNAELISSKVKSDTARLLWLENSYHVATLDNDKDLIIETAGEFFKEIAAGDRGVQVK